MNSDWSTCELSCSDSFIVLSSLTFDGHSKDRAGVDQSGLRVLHYRIEGTGEEEIGDKV